MVMRFGLSSVRIPKLLKLKMGLYALIKARNMGYEVHSGERIRVSLDQQGLFTREKTYPARARAYDHLHLP